MTSKLRIGFIGDGGISRDVRDMLAANLPERFETVAVLARRPGPNCVTTVEALIEAGPQIVVECAGHSALQDYAEPLLLNGISVIVASIGALADAPLLARLSACATKGSAKLVLAPGAMGGIDALAAARVGGLTRVRYTGRKPPHAWAGSPAEAIVDLNALASAETFYRGTARDAALHYPKNANVAATIALAGIGFDDTEVELVADPSISQNVHELMFEGADGRVDIRIAGQPSRANPKTSALTAHSIFRLLEAMASPVVI